MGTQLLATKLFAPPPTPGLVARPRLLSLLDAILHNRLTLISAQAGFGKTTLIIQWIHSKQPPLLTAWLSLEAAENDPSRFWDYVVTSLQAIFPDVGKKALVYFHSSEPVPIESTLTSLINDLALIQNDAIFVLDDYQFIQSEAVQHGIKFFIEHLPPRIHLIIATRTDPPLPLALYRGKGTLLEVRSENLRFTSEEAEELLKLMASTKLSETDIERLNERAEGWVVGLKMAGLAIRGQVEINSFISGFTGSQRYIMDYLVDEVLLRQPPEVVNFLLKTSILGRFCAPLCDAVTKSSHSRQTISAIEKANLFLIPLDTTDEWYRYHHLFRDLLRHRLNTEYGEDFVQELHRQASRWYETHGLFEDAISHALTSRDWPQAIRLIRLPEVQVRWVTTITLLNWLQQLPGDVLRSDHLILFNYVWCLFYTGQMYAVEDCLKYLDTVAVADFPMQGRIANIRACIAGLKGDWPQVETLAGQAIALLKPEGTEKPLWDYLSDYASALFLAGIIRFQRGEFDAAEPFLEQAVRFTRKCEMPLHLGKQMAYLGVIYTARGQLHYARQIIENAIAPFFDDPAVTMAHYVLGLLYYETNNLAASAHHFEQTIKLFHLLKIAPDTVLERANLFQARTLMAMGEIEQVEAALAEADRILPDNPDDRAVNSGIHALIAHCQGDRATVARQLDFLSGYSQLPWEIPPVVNYLFYLRQDKTNALQSIQIISERWQAKAHDSARIYFAILRAVICAQNTEVALAHLSEALAIGKPEGFIRSFVDFGMAITPLLQEAISRGIEPDYARKLLDIIEIEEYHRKFRKPGTSPSDNTLLSPREMEVLRLLADGLTNQQIADKLTISLNTVKTHVYRIFEKLEAKHRGEAIARARELRLV